MPRNDAHLACGVDCAGAALALLVKHGEAWVNPGNRSRRWLGVGKRKREKSGSKRKAAFMDAGVFKKIRRRFEGD